MGLTQQTLSEKMSQSRPQIANIESGRHLPSTAMLYDLCVALQVSSDVLIGLK